MQDGRKPVWSIPYISVAFFPNLKQDFIAYRSSSRPDCIFEMWQSGFSRVYSNCCCSCSFELEIIKIGQSSHKMYSNSILNFQEYTTILNACTKKGLETYWRHHVLWQMRTQVRLHQCIRFLYWGFAEFETFSRNGIVDSKIIPKDIRSIITLYKNSFQIVGQLYIYIYIDIYIYIYFLRPKF